MKEEFDNFAYYYELKKFYAELAQEMRIKHGMERDYDFSMAGNMYCHYMPNFDLKYLEIKCKSLPDEELPTFQRILKEWCYYEEFTQDLLYEICDRIRLPHELAKGVEKAVPFCPHLLKQYAASYDYDKHNVDDFSLSLSLILFYDLYEQFPTEDYEYYVKRKSLMLNILKRNIFVKKYKNEVAYRINKHIASWCKLTSLEEYLPSSLDTEPKRDGWFEITWKYLTFVREYVYVYHPFSPNENPYRMSVKKSIGAFNNIKSYFSGKLPRLRVLAKNGKIIDMENFEDLLSIVEKMSDKYYHTKTTSAVKTTIDFKSLNNNQIREYIKQNKSVYLNWLCEHHIDKYKIIYIREVRTNSNSLDEDEDAFIFTLKESNSHVIVVYENVKEDRSSILFRLPIGMLTKSIQEIHEFFSSNAVNKRELIVTKRVQDRLFTHNKYQRTLHHNFQQWTDSIQKFLITTR